MFAKMGNNIISGVSLENQAAAGSGCNAAKRISQQSAEQKMVNATLIKQNNFI